MADRLNLLYSASAGIITLLTIQNTKKETLLIALKRFLAFVVAVVLAFLIFNSLGYTVFAFGIFIFIFTAVCNLLKLEEGIIMNAVLITHFLIEKNMMQSLILNEVLILLIGMSIGIMVNLIMPKNIKSIKKDQKLVEEAIRNSLSCMAKILSNGSDCKELNSKDLDFKQLNKLIDNLLVKAYEDAGNTFISDTRYQISYLEMRKLQAAILEDIFDSIKDIHNILPQSIEVSQYVNKVAKEFHELNNVESLIKELNELYAYFRKADLPTTRNEFENRAILFNILRDLEHFLQVKRSFIEEN